MPLDFAGRRFAPAPCWTLLALAGMAVFISLGRWQLGRADEKRDLFAAFESGSRVGIELPSNLVPLDRYQRATTAGRYDPSRQFLLDNMTHDGVPGLHVLTPLLRDDGSVVVVDRGFLPSRGRRSDLPDIPVDDAPRRVSGRMDYLPRPAVELGTGPTAGWPRLISFPRVEDLATALGLPVHPQVLLLDAGEPDGFLRDWRPPGMTPDKHVGYAVQWFGLAAAVFATWFILSLRKKVGAT